MEPKKKLSVSHAFPLALIILNAFIGVVLIIFSFSSASRLYRDIGALPWRDPKIQEIIYPSASHSSEDIALARDAVIRTYEDEWHTYNGVYMLELTYYDDFDAEKQDENDGEWIYFKSRVYTGFGSDVAKENKGRRQYVYWAAEKQPDGSWVCHGCRELTENIYGYDFLS